MTVQRTQNRQLATRIPATERSRGREDAHYLGFGNCLGEAFDPQFNKGLFKNMFSFWENFSKPESENKVEDWLLCC